MRFKTLGELLGVEMGVGGWGAGLDEHAEDQTSGAPLISSSLTFHCTIIGAKNIGCILGAKLVFWPERSTFVES